MAEIELHETVASQSYLLSDKEGNTRACLALNHSGEPDLTFYDCNGTPVMCVGLGECSRPNITLFDGGSKPLIGLGITGEGAAGLAIADPEHDHARVVLTVEPEGTVMLGIRDAEAVDRVCIMVSPEGFVRIETTGENGKRTL